MFYGPLQTAEHYKAPFNHLSAHSFNKSKSVRSTKSAHMFTGCVGYHSLQ